MIEVQLDNKEIFDELKFYASYSSDLTLVCAFREEMADMLRSYNVKFDESQLKIKEEKEEVIPTLTIVSGKVMKLVNAQAEMLHYVGVRSEMDPTIPITKMDEVHNLIKNGLVKRDEKFKSLYSPIGYNAKIGDLICSKIRFMNKGRLIDYIDTDSTIRGLKIGEVRETPINYKQFNVKVFSPIMRAEGKRYAEFSVKDDSNNIIKLRFYNKCDILKSIAFKGNEFSFATNKVQEEHGYNRSSSLVVYDPIILPKGMDLFEDKNITPKGRTIPADLYRNAYYEFYYRYHANDYKD